MVTGVPAENSPPCHCRWRDQLLCLPQSPLHSSSQVASAKARMIATLFRKAHKQSHLVTTIDPNQGSMPSTPSMRPAGLESLLHGG